MTDESKFDISKVLDDAVSVITNPTDFYRNMKREGGFAEPIIFLVVMAAVMGVIMTVFSLFGGGRIGAMAVGFGAIIFMPIMALIMSFIAAGIMFVVWKLMGSNESFETAYRCIAYASAIYPIVAIVSLIPYIGTIIGVAWGTFLLFTASVEVHQLARKTAMIVIGILGFIILIMNVSGEIGSRHLESRMEQMGSSLEGMEDMTPEEAGKAVGEFLKGFEQGAGKSE